MRKLLGATVVLLGMTGVGYAAGSPHMLCVQEQLSALGYDTGTPDGVVGGMTRAAAESYLAAEDAVADLPAISNETAEQWCTSLAVMHPEVSSFAAVRPGDVVVAHDTVSERQKALLARGLLLSHDLFKRRIGVMLDRPVQAFAGTDATWLTDNYLKVKNLHAGFRGGKMKEFGSCEPPAEAGYYVMFLCLNNQAWKRGDAESLGIVAHEYTHNLQFGLVGEPGKNCCTDNVAMSIFGPQWLVEGSAEYMKFVLWDEMGYRSLKPLMRDLQDRVRNADLDLIKMETRMGFRENPSGWDVGPLATHYLLRDRGLASLAVFWAEIGEGTEMGNAFRLAFGRTTEEFNAEFAAAIN